MPDRCVHLDGKFNAIIIYSSDYCMFVYEKKEEL